MLDSSHATSAVPCASNSSATSKDRRGNAGNIPIVLASDRSGRNARLVGVGAPTPIIAATRSAVGHPASSRSRTASAHTNSESLHHPRRSHKLAHLRHHLSTFLTFLRTTHVHHPLGHLEPHPSRHIDARGHQHAPRDRKLPPRADHPRSMHQQHTHALTLRRTGLDAHQRRRIDATLRR